MTAKCHLLSNRYFHCHKKIGLSPTIFTVNKNNILKWVIIVHLARPRMATVLIGRCHISMNQNNNFEWKIVSHLVSVRLPFRRILRNIFIFRFRVRKQTSKKRPDRWIFWNSAGIDRIETNRIVMQDSGQANQNAEQAKPRTTNQLDYIKKVVFKSVAKHKHAWPFQVKRKSRIINLHKLHFV